MITQSYIRISLERTERSENDHRFKMTVSKGLEREQLAVAVSEETAWALEAILREEPFSVTKPGIYGYEVQEISEGPGLPKILTLQISKGRARTKRCVAVGNELFFTIWNLLHFQELPSKLPAQRRHK